MTIKNDLLLRTARGEKVERPPIWIMRQAGRILPEYRAVREQLRNFTELVTTPERAAEVTIQPVEILGVDAAIIFSDILVIPEAMGFPYDMVEKHGPTFKKVIENKNDIDKLLTGPNAAENLQYVYDAISITKKNLQGSVPLIGFAGAPWTILAYMIEGNGSKTFSKAKKFLYTEPTLAHTLLQKITDATIAYLQQQIRVGANLIQLFDSWAGILSPEQYSDFSTKYIMQICDAITEVPTTIFAKGAWFALSDFAATNCTIIGLDWNTTPQFAKNYTKNKVLQGNLDPCCLYSSPEIVAEETLAMIRQFGGNHIVNLGHGVYPDTPLESVHALIKTVKNYSY